LGKTVEADDIIVVVAIFTDFWKKSIHNLVSTHNVDMFGQCFVYSDKPKLLCPHVVMVKLHSDFMTNKNNTSVKINYLEHKMNETGIVHLLRAGHTGIQKQPPLRTF
jgi:hypothetical protein